MLTARDRDLALIATLRAERAAADQRDRCDRLAEAQRWEEYLLTALDQLTARFHRARQVVPVRRQHTAEIRRDAA